MDWNTIGKIILGIIGLFAVTSLVIYIKVRISQNRIKKVEKSKQIINGDRNIQAGRDINIK